MTVLLVANIFAVPLFLSNAWDRLVSRAVVTLIIISGLGATVRSRRLIALGSLLALTGFIVGWYGAAYPTLGLRLVNDAAALLMLAIMLVLIARQVFREGTITMRRVRGSVAVYLLIGLIWGIAYDMVEAAQPGSFSVGKSFHGTDLGVLGYYSFTTLTTLGVGDILPLNPVARSLTMLEALVGQLFPAILIARLVSMELIHRYSRPGDRDDK